MCAVGVALHPQVVRPGDLAEPDTDPRKDITNGFAGLSYSSSGLPTCSIRPWLSTAIRSATSSASSWSWVTSTVVT